MKVSLIILSWNTKNLLRDCLKSIALENIFETIVVDNNSIDGSQEMVEKSFSKVKLIKNKKNLGFAKGNNQGIKKAKGDLIMILNSDTIISKGSLKELAGAFVKDDKIAAVSPLLLFKSGEIQEDYYMKFPNLWQIFLYHNRLLRSLILKTPLKNLILSRLSNKRITEVQQLPGAALMAKREIWEKVGLLDESYHFLYEDVDWCFRAKKLGLKLVVVPEAKIIHIGGGSWKKRINNESLTFYKQYFTSMLLFVKKNYGQLKLKFFKIALVINFLVTFKFRLAFYFLFKKEIKQEKLWA